MKNVYKQKRQQALARKNSAKSSGGFTIIEVMIVLAIAAVILLIVLLAVPALQRNSRNTQRNNDAAQFAAAVTTCLSNHNGDTGQCENTGPQHVDVDFSKFGQLTSATYDTAGTGTGSKTDLVWMFNVQCDSGNNYSSTDATARSFAVRFQLESTSGSIQRCIAS